MPQRAATFARRPSGARAAERARSMGEPAGAPVALDIRSLVAPYKRNRGLSIRVERLMHGARLTQGRNNGDRSWSLLPDDLDDLEYVPAAAAYEAHTLAVRIISLDGGDGETLAVIDLPIAGVAPPEPRKVEVDGQAAAGIANADEIAQLRRELADAAASLTAREAELAKAASSLASRDVELSAARKRIDAEKSRGLPQADLAMARQAWERELQNRLAAAAAESKAALDKARAEWEADQGTRLIRSEAGAHRAVEDARRRAKDEQDAALSKARADWKAAEAARFSAAEAVWREDAAKTAEDLRARAEAAEKSLADANAALTRARSGESEEQRRLRDEDARRRARDEQDAALGKARADWKAAEAARFSAAEAVWREEASKTATDLRARAEAAEKSLAEANAALSHTRSSEAEEHRRLRDRLAQAQASLAARGVELAEARAAADLARKAGQDATAELRKAEEARKSAETARIAAIEAQWKQRSDSAVAEIGLRLEQAENALAESRAHAEARLHQVTIAQAALKSREAELDQLRSASEQTRLQLSGEAEAARAAWKQELESSLAKAQHDWQAAEAARFAAAEAQWNAQLATSTAGNTAEVQDLQGSLLQAQLELQALRDSSAKDMRRLRDDLAAAKISLSTVEHELATARAAADQARAAADQPRQTVAAEIEKARAQWQQQADDALAQAKTAWSAEEKTRVAAAVASRVQAEKSSEAQETADQLQRTEAALADVKACADALRRELTAAQGSLSHRELELAEAHAMIEQERERVKHAPISAPERKPRWEVDEEERRAQFRKRLIRDLAIVCCLVGLAFIAYPRVQPVVADAIPQSVAFNARFQPLLQMAGLAKAPPPATAVEPHAIVDVRVANLRAQPSTDAAVVTKLARNMEVTTVEHRGKWVFVRVGDGANQQQGWVSSSVLKDMDATGSTAAE